MPATSPARVHRSALGFLRFEANAIGGLARRRNTHVDNILDVDAVVAVGVARAG
jgi:hypothetical protein